MSHAIDNNPIVDDKTAMRRLGMAIMAMCAGTVGIVVLSIVVGQLH